MKKIPFCKDLAQSEDRINKMAAKERRNDFEIRSTS